MEKRDTIILAIKSGSKYLGIAVFKGLELVDWRIKRVKITGMKPAQVVKKSEMIIAKIIDDYKPKIMVLEEAYFIQSKKSKVLNEITSRIEGLGKERGLRVCFFNASEVREFICHDKRATKMKTEKKIAVEYYPWLYWRYEADRKKPWYEKAYHTILFDAVALGIYYYQINNRKDLGKKAA